MKSKKTDQPARAQENGSHITDVTLFFQEITEAYLDFSRRVLLLTDKISAYSPHKISSECTKLNEERDKLTDLDKQMIDIIKLASPEIAQEQMIDDYRMAFTKTVRACSTLHQKLTELKISLENERDSIPE